MSGKTYKKRTNAKRSYRRKSNMTRKASFAKAVKKVIHKMAEDKIQTNYATNISMPPIGTGSGLAPPSINLLPRLDQGPTQQQRIGNKVSVVSSKLKLMINCLPYNGTTNVNVSDFIVKVFIVSIKQYKPTVIALGLSDIDNFFQVGNASVSFQANVLDNLFEVNRDLFTIHRQTQFTLSQNTPPSMTTSGTTASRNGVCHKELSFNLSKYMKNLQYNDNTPGICSNKNLFCVMQTVRTDGLTAALADVYCEYHYALNTKFEDL